MEKRILFVSSELFLRQIAALIFAEKSDEVELVFCNSLKTSIETLKQDSNFDLIFLGHKIKVDDELKNLTTELLPIINSKSSIISGTNKAFKGKEWAKYFHQLTPPKKILYDISKLLFSEVSKKEYLKFPLGALLEFDKYPFNCFFGIKKNEGINYLQVFREKEEVEFDSVYKYQQKGAKTVFIKTKEIEAPLNELNKRNEDSPLSLSKESPEESISLSAEYALEILQGSGFQFNQTIQNIPTDSFKSIDKIMDGSGHKEELQDLLNQKTRFFYKHISMTTLIGCYLLDEINLKDRVMKEKIGFAAFFQNIFLNTKEELLYTHESEIAHFASQEKKRIQSHPALAAKFLRSNQGIDQDVIKLVKEQHGTQGGMEYGESISSTLKLSLIFQIATYFSQQFLKDYEEDGEANSVKIYQQIQKRMDSRNLSLLKGLHTISSEISNEI